MFVGIEDEFPSENTDLKKNINNLQLGYTSGIMEREMVTITKKEYDTLKKHAQADEELLKDIAKGIKDILEGKVKEV